MRKVLLAMMLAFLYPAPGFAAPSLSSAIPSADALDRMCSEKGVMQYQFGQTGVPGATKLEELTGSRLSLPSAFAPFTQAIPSGSEWSGRLAQMRYSVDFEPAEKSSALTLVDKISEVLEQAGWQPLNLDLEDAPLFLIGFTGENAFYKDIEIEGGKTRLFASLMAELGTLELACGREDMIKLHAGEAFGKLPPGTPRPLMPDIPVPLIASLVECNLPEIAEKFRPFVEEHRADGFMAAMLTRTTYRDRLTTWMIWRLDSSGKISSDRLIKLSIGAIGKASPGGDPFATFGMIEEMFPMLDGIAAAAAAKDPVAMCRQMIPFHAWIRKVDAITLRQTQAAQTALQAEAARLGVSFD